MTARLDGMSLRGALLSLALSISCSANDEADSGGNGGPGGEHETGGVPAGGFATATGDISSGGSSSGTGGGAQATGGDLATGGVLPGTGGTVEATGGDLATGGALAGTGGGSVATGGVMSTGGSVATGGVVSTGGTVATGGGTPTTGGSAPDGGAPTSGGAPTGGSDPGTGGAAGTVGTGGDDAAAINACMDQLPWGARNMSASERAPIVQAIINTCIEFAPAGPEWQSYCQMFLVAAINKESSYNTQSVVEDSYGGAADPTVGLLQIRFSSTVQEYANNGPLDALARIGCDFGTVGSGDSWATKSSMMLDVACNVALGAWYYFLYGSGNGGSNVVYVYQYCQGAGTAGTLHIGMASHLLGAEAAHSNISQADAYYDEIKSWFDPCVSYSGTHPFELAIQPDPGKYCE